MTHDRRRCSLWNRTAARMVGADVPTNGGRTPVPHSCGPRPVRWQVSTPPGVTRQPWDRSSPSARRGS